MAFQPLPYHCAAMISFVPEDAEAMMQVNAQGTANVVDAALYSGVKKMIHDSWCSCILPTPKV